MRRLEALGIVIAMLGGVADAEEAGFRYRAPVTIERAAPFVQMALPASAYARSAHALRDLRLVDARGERVPFALLEPHDGVAQRIEQPHDAPLYALPPRPAAPGAEWPSPLDLTIEGNRVRVERRAATPVAPATSPGWLIDLGARQPGDPAPELLRLAWPGTAEFSAGFSIEVSSDLRQWRSGGSGQVLALSSAAGPLVQPDVVLPDDAGRFVRLVWHDAAAAPALASAQAISVRRDRVAADPVSELIAAPMAVAPAAPRGLVFDLGATLPLETLDLRLAPGTLVVPLRWQGRIRADQPWHDLGASVVYRLEREGAVSSAPPLHLQAGVRYVRALPDERAAALDPAATRLVVQARLASLVFARQGEPPFALLAGATDPADAAPSALPISTLVPALDDERARFGQATLGAWTEQAEAARAADAAARQAAWRPWLLWSVLLAGVAGLGATVWRLARAAR